LGLCTGKRGLQRIGDIVHLDIRPRFIIFVLEAEPSFLLLTAFAAEGYNPGILKFSFMRAGGIVLISA
jgi:hypothetical protein